MIAGINLEIVQPSQNSPKEGCYELNVHLWPICSSEIRAGAAPEEAFSLADFLNKTIFEKKNKVIDMSQLCVEEGMACWVMKIDVLCLEHDGNLEDAASLAIVSALRDLRIPAHEYEEEKNLVHLIEGDAKSLHIQHTLMTSTFGLFEKKQLLCDPTFEEEGLMDTKITITLDEHERILSMYVPGSSGIDESTLMECLRLSSKRSKYLASVLDDSSG